MRLRSGDKHHLRKSAYRKAQIRKPFFLCLPFHTVTVCCTPQPSPSVQHTNNSPARQGAQEQKRKDMTSLPTCQLNFDLYATTKRKQSQVTEENTRKWTHHEVRNRNEKRGHVLSSWFHTLCIPPAIRLSVTLSPFYTSPLLWNNLSSDLRSPDISFFSFFVAHSRNIFCTL